MMLFKNEFCCVLFRAIFDLAIFQGPVSPTLLELVSAVAHTGSGLRLLVGRAPKRGGSQGEERGRLLALSLLLLFLAKAQAVRHAGTCEAVHNTSRM
jgi:hypothetical protein